MGPHCVVYPEFVLCGQSFRSSWQRETPIVAQLVALGSWLLAVGSWGWEGGLY